MQRRQWWLSLILLIPYIALLIVPFYNSVEPTLAGFPFFYVWLGLWIVLTAILTWVVFHFWRA